MDRRNFIKTTSAVAGATLTVDPAWLAGMGLSAEDTWFDRPMRWAQLTLVENDPGNFDPDFWLGYFRQIHADGATLSAGGVVAYYPTDIPMHHRSKWLGDSDPFGYLVEGCRKMNMSIIARTDPHATWQNMYDAHPDRIHVLEDGSKRRHWSNPELWVTCALGPYNFEFMTPIHREIMERYQPDGIFSNRWAGHGICYCEHCQRNFREYAGLDLPRKRDRHDPVYQQYSKWRIQRLRELWLLWDGVIRGVNPSSRFIPNGFPDKVVTGQLSDIVFTDHQARRGYTMPWDNGMRAKELRASIGMKPLGGIFSVGVEERYRWKDSVQTEEEIRIWVAEGTANGMRPWFTKFSGTLYDRRWLKTVDKIYQVHYRMEKYLRNTAPMARVAMVYSERMDNYGTEQWQDQSGDHGLGMYQALLEARVPFEMVNDRLLDPEHLAAYKLLVLPNIALLSDQQCAQLRTFVEGGGSLLATFETSLYGPDGKRRGNFGLADLFGASFQHEVEGPMKNSYLRLRHDGTDESSPRMKAEGPGHSNLGRNTDATDDDYHPVLEGLKDAYRIINSIHMVKARPTGPVPLPVTKIPSYPDLPMEHVYPRVPETDIPGVYLNETGKGRIAYFPGDIDRSYWQIMCADHGRLLGNTVRWALNEAPIAEVEGPGVVDVTVWRQAGSMTVHLVNLTNPRMMKGPFREFHPVDLMARVRLPRNSSPGAVRLLVRNDKPAFLIKDGYVTLRVPRVLDHEVIAIDLA